MKPKLQDVSFSSNARRVCYNLHAYEPKVMALFTSLLRKDSVVFDIGTWIGNYTLLVANKA
jgi:hypothetical protein